MHNSLFQKICKIFLIFFHFGPVWDKVPVERYMERDVDARYRIVKRFIINVMKVQTCDDEEKFLAEEQTAKEGLAILENMFQMLVCGVLYWKAKWQEVHVVEERRSGNTNLLLRAWQPYTFLGFYFVRKAKLVDIFRDTS